MPKKGLFVFPDPLLTEKLLAFASYLDENNRQTEIALKLSRDVYKYTYFLGRRAPVYYTSDHSPAALNKFINSKLFDLLKKELDTCIQYLNDWVIEGNVMVSNDGETIPAVSILNYFLERLKSDFYSDHRTFFYSEGKKNIEVIAVLIRDENISLEFRKKIIITLLSDEGLTLCAGGGLARLSEAAENLKNYGLFTANGLIKRFIVVIAKEAALRGMQFRKNNPSQLICLLTKVSIEDYEIHALNYLLARLRSDLNLQFLVIPSDPNIETIKHYLQEQQSVAEAIYSNYLNEFKRQLTASNLVKFISCQLYEQCLHIQSFLQQEEKYYAVKAFLELKFENLGEDSAFRWDEIFSDDGNLLKVDKFMITIIERLVNGKWLAFPKRLDAELRQNRFFLPCSSKEEAMNILDLDYRFYPSNIALSWVKVKKEDKRKPILDVIALKDGFNELNSRFYLYAINLKYLLQSLKDVCFFLSVCLYLSTKKY